MISCQLSEQVDIFLSDHFTVSSLEYIILMIFLQLGLFGPDWLSSFIMKWMMGELYSHIQKKELGPLPYTIYKN